MVEVRIREDGATTPASFFAEGHAGWSEAGTDIVCAAVSTLLQAAWLGLTEYAGVTVVGSRKAGCLELHWPAAAREREDVRAIIAVTTLSLDHIAAQYPDHVRVVRERVPSQEGTSHDRR